MNVLIVSWCFPPFNMIGSVRTGKTAKYLHRLGHDIRVLAAEDLLVDPSQPVEIPEENVLRTPWVRLDSPAVWLLGGRGHVQKHGYERQGRLGTVLEKFKPLYRTLVQFPDAQAGWILPALRRVKPWLSDWQPDIILASSLPLSSAWVAAVLSKQLRVPWVSELRDLSGMDHEPTDAFSALRRPLDVWAFNRVMSTASGLVTVSKPMQKWLENRFPKIPAECVYNGFDLDDFPKDVDVPYNDGDLHITHTGSLYLGLRDPTPLFKALSLLGNDRNRVHVHFYGRYTQFAADVAREEGVESSVTIHSSVPYTESLRAQMSSDLLLLLMVNKPSKDGSYTGKLFEYLAAKRPILALGRDQNAACTLIRERNAGFVSLEPQRIADQLRHWLDLKQTTNHIPPLQPHIASEFSREEQTLRFERFLKHIIQNKDLT